MLSSGNKSYLSILSCSLLPFPFPHSSSPLSFTPLLSSVPCGTRRCLGGGQMTTLTKRLKRGRLWLGNLRLSDNSTPPKLKQLWGSPQDVKSKPHTTPFSILFVSALSPHDWVFVVHELPSSASSWNRRKLPFRLFLFSRDLVCLFRVPSRSFCVFLFLEIFTRNWRFGANKRHCDHDLDHDSITSPPHHPTSPPTQ